MANEKLIEKVAELCHTQWSGWMEYLFEKCKRNSRGHIEIPKWCIKRWMRQMQTSYENLSETEKESDKIEARKFVELFKQEGILKD